jgi:hypothetical protein
VESIKCIIHQKVKVGLYSLTIGISQELVQVLHDYKTGIKETAPKK